MDAVTATDDRAERLRRLAALLRAGLTVRQALQRCAPDELALVLRLGVDLPTALARAGPGLGGDGALVRTAVGLSLRTGADLAALLDSLAASADRRDTQDRNARSAGAGALLSARMISGLPLVVAALMPLSGRLPTDALGATLLAAGVALGLWGMVWIGRLFPQAPDADDGWAALADLLAAAGAAGADPFRALDAVARSACEGLPDLGAPARRVVLGSSWVAALRAEGGPGAELAALLEQASSWGQPIAGTLRAWAEHRRETLAARFEGAIRRAPVLMVVPLVVCVLPSFVLVALAPFLRSLAPQL